MLNHIASATITNYVSHAACLLNSYMKHSERLSMIRYTTGIVTEMPIRADLKKKKS